MLNKPKAVAKAPAAPKKTPGPAHAPAKPAAKKTAPKVASKPAPKASKKPAGAKKPTKKAIKNDLKHQKARQPHRIKKAKNVEKLKNNKPKKGKNAEIKSLPHPKKNLKKALKGVSNGGKVGKNLDYSKLVVDSLRKYHELVEAVNKKDMKKYHELKAWVKKNAHMDVKKFMSRFKFGKQKIKLEVLTNGANQTTHGTPKELQKKLDKSDMEDELHKFRIGEAKGRVMPKKIRNTLKKIKNGKITDTKIGHIGGYHYLFVYVHQNAP